MRCLESLIGKRGVFKIELITKIKEFQKMKGCNKHIYQVDEAVTRSLYCSSIFYRKINSRSILKTGELTYKVIDERDDLIFIVIAFNVVEDNQDIELVIIKINNVGVYTQNKISQLDFIDLKGDNSIYNN